MELDFGPMSWRQRYKMLLSTVVPRPIAWVTTVDQDGVVNAAPYSFFNAMCADPPLLVFGTEADHKQRSKDTQHNIRVTNELVVNLVSMDIAEAMNITSIDFPPGVNELEKAGLTTTPSRTVRPPRIAESPVSFECTRLTSVEVGRGSALQIAQVQHMHIKDEFYDPERQYILTDKMHLVGRMGGSGNYTRTEDIFQLKRISYEQWSAENGSEMPEGDHRDR